MTRPRAAEEKPALRAADIAEVRLYHLHPREHAAFRRTITARALARYEARRAEITFTNAVLEGSTFTLPEVRTLLEEGAEEVAADAAEAVDANAGGHFASS